MTYEQTTCMPCRRAPNCAMAPLNRKSLKDKDSRLSTHIASTSFRAPASERV